MRILQSLACVLIIILTVSCSVPVEETSDGGFETFSGPYFGLEAPGPIPQLFMPGLVSTYKGERTLCFLDNGTLCVIGRDHETLFTFEKDGRWTAPQLAPFSYREDMPDSTAGPDSRTLYFMTSRPVDNEDNSDTHHLWTIKWLGKTWGTPHPLAHPEKIPGNGSGYPTATSNGTVYFISDARNGFGNGGIYRSRFPNGSPQPAQLVERPINSEYSDFDPCVAPDESYLLFNSNRPGGFGSWDTYICFRQGDDGWTPPINLGAGYNSSSSECCSTISSDGKYFFFVSSRKTNISKGDEKLSATRDRDNYWVDTSFIERLKARYQNTESSADRIFEAYHEKGVSAAIERLNDLHMNHRSTYSFLANDLLRVCETMISDGKVGESDQFFQAMVHTLPETARIKLGYALICSLNGLAEKGLMVFQEIESSDTALDFEDAALYLGHMLMDASQATDAKLFFEFNSQRFPNSYRSFYYLGVAAKDLDDIDLASQSWQRAQQLNPGSDAISELLAELEADQ